MAKIHFPNKDYTTTNPYKGAVMEAKIDKKFEETFNTESDEAIGENQSAHSHSIEIPTHVQEVIEETINEAVEENQSTHSHSIEIPTQTFEILQSPTEKHIAPKKVKMGSDVVKMMREPFDNASVNRILRKDTKIYDVIGEKTEANGTIWYRIGYTGWVRENNVIIVE